MATDERPAFRHYAEWTPEREQQAIRYWNVQLRSAERDDIDLLVQTITRLKTAARVLARSIGNAYGYTQREHSLREHVSEFIELEGDEATALDWLEAWLKGGTMSDSVNADAHDWLREEFAIQQRGDGPWLHHVASKEVWEEVLLLAHNLAFREKADYARRARQGLDRNHSRYEREASVLYGILADLARVAFEQKRDEGKMRIMRPDPRYTQ